jgi:hypothetical protein
MFSYAQNLVGLEVVKNPTGTRWPDQYGSAVSNPRFRLQSERVPHLFEKIELRLVDAVVFGLGFDPREKNRPKRRYRKGCNGIRK